MRADCGRCRPGFAMPYGCVHPVKTPRRGQGVGSLLNVGDLSPSPISQKRVCKFVGDNVICKLLRCVVQLRPEDNAASAVAIKPGGWHPQRPAFSRFVVVNRHVETRVVQKITLDFGGDRLKYGQHALLQYWIFSKRLDVGVEMRVMICIHCIYCRSCRN